MKSLISDHLLADIIIKDLTDARNQSISNEKGNLFEVVGRYKL